MTDKKSEDMKRAYGEDHLWLGELDRIWWVDWTQPDADARERLTGQAEGHKPGEPERRSALYDRAVQSAITGRLDLARGDVEALVSEGEMDRSEVVRASLLRGTLMLMMEEFPEAEKTLSSILDDTEVSPAIRAATLVRRANVFRELGDGGRTAVDFDTVAELTGVPPLYLLMARVESAHAALHKMQHTIHEATGPEIFNEPIEKFTAICNMERVDARVMADALLNRGDCYRMAGKFDLAIADFDKVQTLGDAPAFIHIMARLNRAFVLHQTGKFDEALPEYEAIANDDEAPVDQRAKAIASMSAEHLQRDNVEAAVAGFDRILALPECPPENRATALVNRGIAHERFGQDDKALADWDEVISSEEMPQYFRLAALLSRGKMYHRLKRVDEAREDFTAAMQGDAPEDIVKEAQFLLDSLATEH